VSLHPPAMVARLLACPALGFEPTLLAATSLAPSPPPTASGVRITHESAGNATGEKGDCDALDHAGCKVLPPGHCSVVVARRSALSWTQLLHAAAADAAAADATAPEVACPVRRLQCQVAAAHGSALDTWFTAVDPLLTPEREAELTFRWVRAAAQAGAARAGTAGAGARLAAADAYAAMFSTEERSEYGLFDFLEDLAQSRGAEPLTLAEALAFLRENQ